MLHVTKWLSHLSVSFKFTNIHSVCNVRASKCKFYKHGLGVGMCLSLHACTRVVYTSLSPHSWTHDDTSLSLTDTICTLMKWNPAPPPWVFLIAGSSDRDSMIPKLLTDRQTIYILDYLPPYHMAVLKKLKKFCIKQWDIIGCLEVLHSQQWWRNRQSSNSQLPVFNYSTIVNTFLRAIQ